MKKPSPDKEERKEIMTASKFMHQLLCRCCEGDLNFAEKELVTIVRPEKEAIMPAGKSIMINILQLLWIRSEYFRERTQRVLQNLLRFHGTGLLQLAKSCK